MNFHGNDLQHLEQPILLLEIYSVLKKEIRKRKIRLE